MMLGGVLLEVRELSKAFGGVVALDNLTFGVRAGSVTALVGANGAGKTTLFDIVTGLAHPDHGDVLFDGSRITGARPHSIARRGIGRTFQNMRLFRRMSVLDTVMLPWRYQRGESLDVNLQRKRRFFEWYQENELPTGMNLTLARLGRRLRQLLDDYYDIGVSPSPQPSPRGRGRKSEGRTWRSPSN